MKLNRKKLTRQYGKEIPQTHFGTKKHDEHLFHFDACRNYLYNFGDEKRRGKKINLKY